MAFGVGVVIAAHFAPLSLTREQRERVLLALTGRERSEVAWVEEVRERGGVRTTPGDAQLWVTVLPTVEALRRLGPAATDLGGRLRGAGSGRVNRLLKNGGN